MSETSVRVAGGLVDIALKFTFEPAVAALAMPLEAAAEVVEVISLVLPFGAVGDPQVIENLIMGWIKDAKERDSNA